VIKKIILLLMALLIVIPLVRWGIVDATFEANSVLECNPNGACWAMIKSRFSQFMYGFYPPDARWRVNLSILLLLFSLVSVGFLKLSLNLKIMMVVLSFALIVLLLSAFPTDLWGGLFLTLVLAIGAIVCAFPIALFLALGRSSRLTLVRGFCIFFIELVRGVPLISILFMASVMLPLFFPSEWVVDKLLRAFIGLTLFQAAYLAEVIRGGLNSIPTGQFEAASSLGLTIYQQMRFIILPQALRVVIPGMVNSFIALFKDTTLVLIIGMYDFLGIVQTATNDPKWIGTAPEAYLFCAFVYWACCFSMSSYSKYLEKKVAIQ